MKIRDHQRSIRVSVIGSATSIMANKIEKLSKARQKKSWAQKEIEDFTKRRTAELKKYQKKHMSLTI